MSNESRQVIIVRKDLEMSVGKMAAQASHASMAFLTRCIQQHSIKIEENVFPAWGYQWDSNFTKKEKVPQHYRREDLDKWAMEARERGEEFFYAKPVNSDKKYGLLELCESNHYYKTEFIIDKELYKWMNGAFTKTICEAKNRNHLMKAVKYAEELGLKEGKDFFLIKDNCYTELEPEDEDGRTLTAIGFRPMATETAHKISKKFQLFNAEMEKPKKGKWTIPSELSKMFDIYECSACHGRQVMVSDKYKYCPNCGAEMINYENR